MMVALPADDSSSEDERDFFRDIEFPRLLSVPAGKYTQKEMHELLVETLVQLDPLDVSENSKMDLFDISPSFVDSEYSGIHDLIEMKIYGIDCIWRPNNIRFFKGRKVGHKSLGNAPSMVDLNDCFEEHLKPEEIDEWNCEKCQSNQKATKKLEIFKLPKVLIIHFKRFLIDFRTGGWRKNQASVNYPFADNFANYSISPGSDYQLVASRYFYFDVATIMVN